MSRFAIAAVLVLALPRFVRADEPPSYQRHVSAVFSKLGCNGGACHGAVKGQNGFRLSLFGYDFSQGYTSLERDQPAARQRKRPNFIQRWFQRRAQRKAQRKSHVGYLVGSRLDGAQEQGYRQGEAQDEYGEYVGVLMPQIFHPPRQPAKRYGECDRHQRIENNACHAMAGMRR